MQKNKVGILTHPLKYNYGGLLQAYALQEFLFSIGVESCILNFDTMKEAPFYRKMLSVLKTFIIRNLKSKKVNYGFSSTKTENDLIGMKTNIFKYKYFRKVSPELNSLLSFYSFIEEENFKAFIVGSDQVWRPRFFSYFPLYFLSFIKNNEVKKISYAASFGDAKLNLSESNIKMISKQLPLFDFVSVREDDAVKICSNFGVKAQHVLDPTMLLDVSHYKSMIHGFDDNITRKPVFCYVLDESKEVTDVINKVAKKLGKEHYKLKDSVIRTKNTLGIKHDIYQKQDPRSWLKSFSEAEYIVTDSFHGCVFSILFNKPFTVIINKTRGDSRFYSLLRLFNLENRVNLDSLSENVNWNTVNTILDNMRISSKEFINNSLGL